MEKLAPYCTRSVVWRDRSLARIKWCSVCAACLGESGNAPRHRSDLKDAQVAGDRSQEPGAAQEQNISSPNPSSLEWTGCHYRCSRFKLSKPDSSATVTYAPSGSSMLLSPTWVEKSTRRSFSFLPFKGSYKFRKGLNMFIRASSIPL